MKKLLFLLLIPALVHAGDTQEVLDASGKLVSTVNTTGGVKTVRDANGRIIETRTTGGKATTFRDANGMPTQTEKKP